MTDKSGARPRDAWLHPEIEQNDVRRYVATLRQRAWLIGLSVILTTLVAIIYVETATPVYTGQAQLLVTPISGTNADTVAGLGLLAASSDPTQDIETAASLVPSLSAAQAVKQQLKLSDSAQSILKRVSVQPLSQSDILAVTATAPTARQAAGLANAFAQAALAQRTASFQKLINNKIATLSAQLGKTPTNATSQSATGLQQQLAALQAFRAGPLPDMSISQTAAPPLGRTSPRVALSLAAAILAGLVLGILGAFALEVFDTTLRREEQLRRLFRLPVLAKVPLERGSRRSAGRPRLPESMSPPALEAYRTLRAMLLASGDLSRPARSILVTSASPREGKTTTAMNLAVSFAASGSTTILIEADMRRPTIGDSVGIRAPYGLADVLVGSVPLRQALVSSPRYANLRFLLGRSDVHGATVNADVLLLPTVSTLLDDAEREAVHVVIDSPPLAAVIDALELAADADLVLLVARLGHTNLGRLATLGTLLSRAKVVPAGIALIGAPSAAGPTAEAYYTSVQPAPQRAADSEPNGSEQAAPVPLLRRG